MSAIADGPIDPRRLVVERIAHWAGLPEEDVTGDLPWAAFGLSSRDAVAITGELAHAVGRELPTTLLWEAPTVDALVTLLGGAAPGSQAQHTPDCALARQPIAVVGVGCRLPGGVHGPDDYWRLLVEGTDAVTELSPSRRRDFVSPGPPDTNPWGGCLHDATLTGFDSSSFRISRVRPT
ncbi:beta-ketoacyl synthase N-terminal-like domain-containing protein [Streptomyces sp. NPDC005799]|uniref:acyl carrier protein n=1 Tax=Streptomyces sp. NPDC005799 TaxID=3154678 RepID=UPI0033F4DAA7